MQELIRLLEGIVEKDINWSKENALFTEGLIDSIDLAEIISELEDTYDIEITMESMVPENFNSVQAMYRLIEELQ